MPGYKCTGILTVVGRCCVETGTTGLVILVNQESVWEEKWFECMAFSPRMLEYFYIQPEARGQGRTKTQVKHKIVLFRVDLTQLA